MALIGNPVFIYDEAKELRGRCRSLDSCLPDGHAPSPYGWQLTVFSVTYVLAPALLLPLMSLDALETFVATQKRGNKMSTKTASNGHVNHKPAPRRHLLALSIVLLFVAAMYPRKANAQIVGDLQANIPFEFHAGNAKLPAGTYRIRMLDDSDLTLMEIISLNGSSSALFQVQESEAKSTPDQNELIFNKYGDQYFLAEVFDQGESSGSKVTESREEKKISQGSQGTVTTQEHVPVRRPTQQGN